MNKRARFAYVALALALCALLIVIVVVVSRHIAESRRVEFLRPIVKLASVQLDDVLSMEAKTSNITYIEFFQKIAGAVNDLDKAAIEIRTHSSTPPAPEEVEALAYIAAVQSTLRQQSAALRKHMEASLADERVQRDQADTDPSDPNRRAVLEHHLTVVKEAITAAEASISEVQKVAVTLKEVGAMRGAIVRIFGEDAANDAALAVKAAGAIASAASVK